MKPSDLVIQHWPSFASKIEDPVKREVKQRTTVAHLLSHRAGLENAGNAIQEADPFTICKWESMLEDMENAIPESEPGTNTAYHFLSFGWLVGRISLNF